jgi:hypothetical protein
MPKRDETDSREASESLMNAARDRSSHGPPASTHETFDVVGWARRVAAGALPLSISVALRAGVARHASTRE